MSTLAQDLNALSCLVFKMSEMWAKPNYNPYSVEDTRFERAVLRLREKIEQSYVRVNYCTHTTVIGMKSPNQGSVCKDCGLILSSVSLMPMYPALDEIAFLKKELAEKQKYILELERRDG